MNKLDKAYKNYFISKVMTAKKPISKGKFISDVKSGNYFITTGKIDKAKFKAIWWYFNNKDE